MADRCDHCGQTIRKPREKKALVVEFEPEVYRLTELLFELVQANFPFVDKTPSTKDYADMEKLYRLDKRNYALIEQIMRWSQQDPFWRGNIRSVAKLRKQFDTLLIQAVEAQKKLNARVVSV